MDNVTLNKIKHGSMKKTIAGFALLIALVSHAQSDKYNEAMKKTLSLFDSSRTTQDFLGVGCQRNQCTWK